jgi:hypothetical protein
MTAAFSHVARACQMHLSCVSRLARRASDATGLALEAALAKSLVTLCCFWIAHGPVQVRAGSDRSNVDVPRFTAAAWLAKAYRRAAENRLEMPRPLSVTHWRTRIQWLRWVDSLYLHAISHRIITWGFSFGDLPRDSFADVCVRA